jgi:hypothetical protein
MKFEITITGLALIMLFLLTIPSAAADVEPNETPATSEVIGKGTHNGRVDGASYIDCYRVENTGNNEVTVRGKLKNPKMEDSVNIHTVNEYGIPDNQVKIFLSMEYTSDYCHWNDPGTKGVMYIMVEGNGDYELKIEFGDSDDDGGGFLAMGAPLVAMMIGGACFVLAMIIVIIVIIIIVMKAMKPA